MELSMEAFGTLMFLASFFVAFLIAKRLYKKRKDQHPAEKVKNITLGISWYILSLLILTTLSTAIIPTPEKRGNTVVKDEMQPGQKSLEKTEFVRQIGEPKAYSVLKREDKSKQENNRLVSFWIISSDALSLADRAATVRKAAEDLQEQTKIPVVSIFLQFNKSSVGKGYSLASAKYFSDGCQYSGNPCNDEIWAIDASEDLVTATQIKVFDAWYKNRDKFIDSKGNLKEDDLVNFLSRKLKLPISEIKLPFITTEKVNPYYSEEDRGLSLQKMKVQREIMVKKLEDLANRKKNIEKQFSPWDGSHRDLVNRVKNVMNDPDSFKHYETKYIDRGDHITVFMDFGGKNGFGGMIRNSISADYSLDGTFIRVND